MERDERARRLQTCLDELANSLQAASDYAEIPRSAPQARADSALTEKTAQQIERACESYHRLCDLLQEDRAVTPPAFQYVCD